MPWPRDAFAGGLLRTFPLEAGLPPGFAPLDEIEQALSFEERFKAGFWQEVLKEQARSLVRQAHHHDLLRLDTENECSART